jgi:hypothetical protein
MMKNTLKNKIKIALLGGTLMGSGCAPGYDIVRCLDYPDEFVRDSIRYTNGGDMGNNQRNTTTIPANVYWTGKSYRVVPGYDWVNPDDQNDLRVIKIK